MTNVAVVLCIGLLLVTSWVDTSAHKLSTLDLWPDANLAEDAESRFVHRALAASSEQVEKIIDDVIDRAEDAIATAEQQAIEFDEKLKDETTKHQQELDARNEEILMKVGNELNEILQQYAVSACGNLADTVQDTIIAAINNQTQCVIEPLETGLMYIRNIYGLSADIIKDLKGLKEEARECRKTSRGLKEIVKTIICLNKIGVRAIWATAKRGPEITENVIKLHSLVKNLRNSIPKCIIDTGADAVLNNIEDLINDVRECVSEAIESKEAKPVQIPDLLDGIKDVYF